MTIARMNSTEPAGDIKVTEAAFTYVVIDNQGKKQPVFRTPPTSGQPGSD